eukprot:1515489-Amphidinium_carterae.1
MDHWLSRTASPHWRVRVVKRKVQGWRQGPGADPDAPTSILRPVWVCVAMVNETSVMIPNSLHPSRSRRTSPRPAHATTTASSASASRRPDTATADTYKLIVGGFSSDTARDELIQRFIEIVADKVAASGIFCQVLRIPAKCELMEKRPNSRKQPVYLCALDHLKHNHVSTPNPANLASWP